MSFILDALKKSENERQRQSGPGIFEVKVAAPKARWPAWAFALAGLLLINIGVVVWLLLRHPSSSKAAIETPATQAPAPLPAASAPPQAFQTPPVTTASAAPRSAESTASPESATADEDATSGEEGNPADYQPAAEPSVPSHAAESHVTRATAEGFPTYDELATRPGSGLPDLRLDLHVYAVKPQDRFIFLNMHRLREGDSLPEGVRVENITAGGAVLSFHGAKFVLDRE